MAAFQPSEDQAHDLGTTTARWKDVHADKLVISGQDNDEVLITSSIGGTLSVENLSVSGNVSGIDGIINTTVYNPPSANVIMSSSPESDDTSIRIISHDQEGTISLPDASISSGRELIIINQNTDGSFITISPYNADQNIYDYGIEHSLSSGGYQISGLNSIHLVCNGSHWFKL